MTSDPIADMLTRVRNAIQARHPKVDVPASKLKTEISRILKEAGYIANFKVADEGAKRTIKIYLKYGPGNSPVISKIERVSRPGCRVYVGQTDIPRVLGGMGINILTTPRGVMTGRGDHPEVPGPKGTRRVPPPAGITVEQAGGKLEIKRDSDQHAALHGLTDRKSTRLNSSHLVISYAV